MPKCLHVLFMNLFMSLFMYLLLIKLTPKGVVSSLLFSSLPFPSLPFPSLPFSSLPFPSLPFIYLVVCWFVKGAEEGSEVHGAGCQRICLCSRGGHRQGAHTCHTAAQGALPVSVGNVQGPFRGMPFALHLSMAHAQALPGVSLAYTVCVVLFVMYPQLVCQSAVVRQHTPKHCVESGWQTLYQSLHLSYTST